MAPSYAYGWFSETKRTAYRIVADAASEVPKRTAIICGEQRLSYETFASKVETAADVFLAKGFTKGDRVLVVLGNSPEMLIVQYSCSKSGVIPCLLSPVASEQEITTAIKTVKPKGALFPSGFPHEGILEELPLAMNVEELSHRTSVVRARETSAPSDVWMMLFTSGSTGPAKVVPVKYTSVLTSAEFSTKCTRVLNCPGQTCLVPVPLSHVLGAGGTSMVFMNKGTLVLTSGRYSSSNVAKLIETERVNLLYGAPVIFSDLLTQTAQRPQATETLKGAICGGAVVPVALIRALQQRDIVLTEVYGSTEVGGSVVATEHLPEGARTSVLGEIRLVGGKDNRDVVDRNVRGEVCIRGLTVFPGYFDSPEKTAQCMKDGWYHSGDLGIMSLDGQLEICGRLKDIVIRGGENISPAEIEAAIDSHPQTLQCAVFGVPDERMGEELVTWIVLRDQNEALSEGELKQWLAEKLAPFKIPRYVFFVDSLPRTASGKLLKYKMAEDSIRRLQR